MRKIDKAAEPRSLAQYRESGISAKYNNYPYMAELRLVLVQEQRGICCYCMGPLTEPQDAIIEHWRSRSRYPDEQLVYSNLLASCRGGRRRSEEKEVPAEMRHCDYRKGDCDLKFNPADPLHAIEKRISYSRTDGSIKALNDDDFSTQLNDVLGLNRAELKNRRKEVMTAITKWRRIYESKHKKPIPREKLQRKRDALTSESARSLAPYSPVAVWWLDQQLARLSRPSR